LTVTDVLLLYPIPVHAHKIFTYITILRWGIKNKIKQQE